MNGEGVMPCNDVYLCCGRKVVVEVGGCYWRGMEARTRSFIAQIDGLRSSEYPD
jgi:hypothetical protein